MQGLARIKDLPEKYNSTECQEVLDDIIGRVIGDILHMTNGHDHSGTVNNGPTIPIGGSLTTFKEDGTAKGNGYIIDFTTGLDVSFLGSTATISVDKSELGLTTTDVTEGTRLYYTDVRARAAISETITGIDYNSSTGVFSQTTGYFTPLLGADNQIPFINATATNFEYDSKLTYNGLRLCNYQTSVDDLTQGALCGTLTPTTNVDGSANTGTNQTLGNLWTAIKFTVGASNVNTLSFSVRMKKTGALTLATSVFFAYIKPDVGGVPSGSVIATALRMYYGQITNSYAEYHFSVDQSCVQTPITLTAGASYWILLNCNALPATGSIEIDSTNAGTDEWAYSATGADGSWTTEDNKRGWFKIYGQTFHSIYGYALGSSGVYGESECGRGVEGYSKKGYAVYGRSVASSGIFGTSTYGAGVSGIITGTDSAYGVYGSSNNGIAIYGISVSNLGGLFTSSTNIGLKGVSTSNYGVYAQGTNYSAAYIGQDGTPTANNANPVLYINRGLAGTKNATGNIITIIDNPTTSGTINGYLLSATIVATERLRFDPRVADGAAAVAYFSDTKDVLSTAGAKLWSWRNSGTEKAYIGYDGTLGLEGNIIPNSADTATLGDATNRWATLYMASTIDYAGDLVFNSTTEQARLSTAGLLTVKNLTDSGITATHIIYGGVGGLLSGSANFLYDGTDFTMTSGHVLLGASSNIYFGAVGNGNYLYASTTSMLAASTDFTIGGNAYLGADLSKLYFGAASDIYLERGLGDTINIKTSTGANSNLFVQSSILAGVALGVYGYSTNFYTLLYGESTQAANNYWWLPATMPAEGTSKYLKGTTTTGAVHLTWVDLPLTAAGSDTYVQYNNTGTLAGSSKHTWNEGLVTLDVDSGSAGIIKCAYLYSTFELETKGTLKILEGGGTPTKYTIFQGGDQAIDLTYTLPTAYPTTGQCLVSTDAGVMSWATKYGSGDSPSFAAVTATGLTINGATVLNEAGADVDFRVEADTDANLIFADGTGTGKVGIGTATPQSRFQVNAHTGDDWADSTVLSRSNAVIVCPVKSCTSNVNAAMEPVLTLHRLGDAGQTYPQFVDFRLGRYSTDAASSAFTQLDICLNGTSSAIAQILPILSLRGISASSSGGIATNGSGYYWDMAGYTATAPSATGYITVVINGTTYKLLAST